MGYNVTLQSGSNTILNAATATGAGSTFAMKPTPGTQKMNEDYSWQVDFPVAPASCVVNLEGSLDGTNWFQLDQYTGTTASFRSVAGKPVLFIRANVTTLTGASASVSVIVVL